MFPDKSSYHQVSECSASPEAGHSRDNRVCGPERVNSALGFVKSDHRSTMSEGRLNALLRLYVRKDIFEEVVTAYGNKHPRRMLLGRPLDA